MLAWLTTGCAVGGCQVPHSKHFAGLRSDGGVLRARMSEGRYHARHLAQAVCGSGDGSRETIRHPRRAISHWRGVLPAAHPQAGGVGRGLCAHSRRRTKHRAFVSLLAVVRAEPGASTRWTTSISSSTPPPSMGSTSGSTFPRRRTAPAPTGCCASTRTCGSSTTSTSRSSRTPIRPMPRAPWSIASTTRRFAIWRATSCGTPSTATRTGPTC